MRLLSIIAVLLASFAVAQGTSAPDLEQRTDVILTSLKNIQQYCGGIDKMARSRVPLVFAAAVATRPLRWQQFTSPAEWERAGRPRPVALAWMKDDYVAAVRISFSDEAIGTAYADYCFRDDGTLARVSVRPVRQARAGLRETVAANRQWFYASDGKAVGVSLPDRRPFQSETTTYVDVRPPEYRRVSELPFVHLLFRQH